MRGELVDCHICYILDTSCVRAAVRGDDCDIPTLTSKITTRDLDVELVVELLSAIHGHLHRSEDVVEFERSGNTDSELELKASLVEY